MILYGLVGKWPMIPRKGLIDRPTGMNIAFARSDTQPTSQQFATTQEDGGVLYTDTTLEC